MRIERKIVKGNWKVLGRKLGLALVCPVLMGLVAACGDTTATSQLGAIATATSLPVTAPSAAFTITEAASTAPAVSTAVVTTTEEATTVPTATTASPVTTAVATTSEATTTTTSVPTSSSTPSAPTTKPVVTTAPANGPVTTGVPLAKTTTTKAGGGQSHVFGEKDNGVTIQARVGDTLLAGFNTGLDWSFQIRPEGSLLVGPLQAASPYEGSFKAQGPGTVTIKAFGKCRPVAGKVCFNAIIALTITVVIS